MRAGVWLRSSRCESHQCVEVLIDGGTIAVRDAKEADGPVLVFAPSSWQSFVGQIAYLRRPG